MMDSYSWLAIQPELVLLVMACVIAMIDLAVKTPQRTVTYVLTLLTLAAVAFISGSLAVEGDTVYGFLKVNYEWEVYARTTTQGSEFQIAVTFLVPSLKVPKP